MSIEQTSNEEKCDARRRSSYFELKELQASDGSIDNSACFNTNYEVQDEKDKSFSRKKKSKATRNIRQAPNNNDISSIHTTVNFDDKYINIIQDAAIPEVDVNGDVPFDQSLAVIATENINQPISNTNLRNNRLLAVGGVTGIKHDLEPVIEYAEEPLVSLTEACIPLVDILHNVSFYVQMALDETPANPPDRLTIDESAAIRLYTIEWESPHRSLYSMLNYTLKTAPRHELRPYHKYLKLFLTALVKLPCVPPTTVWRGVTKDLSEEFPRGTMVTWWAFSSCTTELTVLENKMYLGTAGTRTLFSVEAINGRTIRAHSHFVTEDEILLLPGTHMEVQSLFSPAPEMFIVHLKQVKPVETLLELPFKGALLYPPEKIKLPWYKKKRTLVELGILITVCIVGVIVGAVIGSRRPPPPPLCFPRRTTLRGDYIWTFDCSDAREDLTGLYNGTLINGTTFASPDFSGQGKALDLNRNLFQYVILPQSLNLTLNTSFTVGVWVLTAGYNPKTILSDCNNYNPICITFIITDVSINLRLSNWNTKNIIQEISSSVQNYVCHNCWMYVSFSFDHRTRRIISYFNGLHVESTYMNLTNTISNGKNETKVSYIGLNAVTKAQPFYGLIDRLCVAYYVKNDSEILFEATVLCRYVFDTDDIRAGTGPSSIRARIQNVYRSLSDNQSNLLLNSSDSYFQSSGFTLLNSNDYAYSISFWLRLTIPKLDKINSAITIFQLTSVISGLSVVSYTCIASLHIYPDNNTMGFFFPELFQIVNVDNSSIQNNTWVHIGVTFNSSSSTYLFYQNGKLVSSNYNARYRSILSDNPRCTLTVGGAYLDDSISNKPDNFEQMKCFARLPILNYTNMYGEIDYLTVDARALNESEIVARASAK